MLIHEIVVHNFFKRFILIQKVTTKEYKQSKSRGGGCGGRNVHYCKELMQPML